MNSPGTRITLRVIGGILVISAAVRFAIESFSSFHTETHSSPNGGGTIDHTLAINNVTIMIAIAGILLFALSLLASRKRL
jgi:small-conductance mechanosensitive channel